MIREMCCMKCRHVWSADPPVQAEPSSLALRLKSAAAAAGAGEDA